MTTSAEKAAMAICEKVLEHTHYVIPNAMRSQWTRIIQQAIDEDTNDIHQDNAQQLEAQQQVIDKLVEALDEAKFFLEPHPEITIMVDTALTSAKELNEHKPTTTNTEKAAR